MIGLEISEFEIDVFVDSKIFDGDYVLYTIKLAELFEDNPLNWVSPFSENGRWFTGWPSDEAIEAGAENKHRWHFIDKGLKSVCGTKPQTRMTHPFPDLSLGPYRSDIEINTALCNVCKIVAGRVLSNIEEMSPAYQAKLIKIISKGDHWGARDGILRSVYVLDRIAKSDPYREYVKTHIEDAISLIEEDDFEIEHDPYTNRRSYNTKPSIKIRKEIKPCWERLKALLKSP